MTFDCFVDDDRFHFVLKLKVLSETHYRVWLIDDYASEYHYLGTIETDYSSFEKQLTKKVDEHLLVRYDLMSVSLDFIEN